MVCTLVVIYVTVVAAAAGVWTWINLSPAIKSNLDYILDPLTPPPEAPPEVSPSDLTPQASSLKPQIAILVPGRNEADHLSARLTKLCEQNDAHYRVIFIDDASDDATPTLTAALAAKYAHLSVLRLEGDPPAGWVGKCWAIHRGYQHLCELEQASPTQAPAPLILFTDADIDFHPNVLQTARQVMREHEADVVSLFPRLKFGSAGEAIVQLQLMLALGIIFPVRKAIDPKHPDTLTGGAFILVRRSYYDKIGGHESVRDEMVDDINLGRRLKACGASIYLSFAPHLLSTRMYDGFADQWEGLTKNAYAGLDYHRGKALGLMMGALLLNVLPPVYVVIGWVWCAREVSMLSVAALLLAVWAVGMQWRVLNTVRKLAQLPARYAWTLGIGSAIYIAIMLGSMWDHHTGGNHWKGRTFRPLSDRPPAPPAC